MKKKNPHLINLPKGDWDFKLVDYRGGEGNLAKQTCETCMRASYTLTSTICRKCLTGKSQWRKK